MERDSKYLGCLEHQSLFLKIQLKEMFIRFSIQSIKSDSHCVTIAAEKFMKSKPEFVFLLTETTMR